MQINIFAYVLIGFIVSAVLLPITSSFVLIDVSLIGIISWLGLTDYIISVFIWIRILKIRTSSKAAGLSLLTPFSTLLFVKLVFPETQMGIYQAIGLILILAGAALQNERKNKSTGEKS